MTLSHLRQDYLADHRHRLASKYICNIKQILIAQAQQRGFNIGKTHRCLLTGMVEPLHSGF